MANAENTGCLELNIIEEEKCESPKKKKNLVTALKRRTEMKLLMASMCMNTENCISHVEGNRDLTSHGLGCKKEAKTRG